MRRERRRLQAGFLAAIFALAVIALPLAWHAATQLQGVVRSSTGAPLVQAWIGDRDLQVTSWSIDGDTVLVAVTGPDAPPSAAPLAASLAKAYGVPVTVEITYVAAFREQATSAP
jgi:hypothetical protein